MRTLELVIAYGAFGMIAAAALLLVARGRLADAALLVPFWPIYGPFLVLGAKTTSAEGFLDRLLPNAEAVSALYDRLAVAKARVDEIDALLARDEFSIAKVEARHRALIASGDERAAASASARQENIRRLERLRARFSSELVEIDELLAQLRVQAEVVRFAGEADEATQQLVVEILSRVEGLDMMLHDEPPTR